MSSLPIAMTEHELRHCPVTLPKDRSRNYTLIEALAVCAAGLEVYECGHEMKKPELYAMVAQKFMAHIDHLLSFLTAQL